MNLLRNWMSQLTAQQNSRIEHLRGKPWLKPKIVSKRGRWVVSEHSMRLFVSDILASHLDNCALSFCVAQNRKMPCEPAKNGYQKLGPAMFVGSCIERVVQWGEVVATGPSTRIHFHLKADVIATTSARVNGVDVRPDIEENRMSVSTEPGDLVDWSAVTYHYIGGRR